MKKHLELWGHHYEVTDDGRVFREGVEMPPHYNHDGYLVVTARTETGGYRAVGVHRLVALAFIENDDPATKTEVNQKNYIRDDNHVDNLEWMSHADNIRYSVWRRDISGEKNPNYGNHKLSEKYANDKELSKEKQGRPGLQNGRCRAIDMFKDGKLIASFDYTELCVKYLIEQGISHATPVGLRSQIDRSIRKHQTYKGFTFVKH